MWACLALTMDPRHRLVNCMILIDDMFSNMNKIDLIDSFNNKIKTTLYILFKEYVSNYGEGSSSSTHTSSFVWTHITSISSSSFWSRLNKKKEKYVKSTTNNELENYLECEFAFSELEIDNLDILK